VHLLASEQCKGEDGFEPVLNTQWT